MYYIIIKIGILSMYCIEGTQFSTQKFLHFVHMHILLHTRAQAQIHTNIFENCTSEYYFRDSRWLFIPLLSLPRFSLFYTEHIYFYNEKWYHRVFFKQQKEPVHLLHTFNFCLWEEEACVLEVIQGLLA